MVGQATDDDFICGLIGALMSMAVAVVVSTGDMDSPVLPVLHKELKKLVNHMGGDIAPFSSTLTEGLGGRSRFDSSGMTTIGSYESSTLPSSIFCPNTTWKTEDEAEGVEEEEESSLDPFGDCADNSSVFRTHTFENFSEEEPLEYEPQEFDADTEPEECDLENPAEEGYEWDEFGLPESAQDFSLPEPDMERNNNAAYNASLSLGGPNATYNNSGWRTHSVIDDDAGVDMDCSFDPNKTRTISNRTFNKSRASGRSNRTFEQVPDECYLDESLQPNSTFNASGARSNRSYKMNSTPAAGGLGRSKMEVSGASTIDGFDGEECEESTEYDPFGDAPDNSSVYRTHVLSNYSSAGPNDTYDDPCAPDESYHRTFNTSKTAGGGNSYTMSSLKVSGGGGAQMNDPNTTFNAGGYANYTFNVADHAGRQFNSTQLSGGMGRSRLDTNGISAIDSFDGEQCEESTELDPFGDAPDNSSVYRTHVISQYEDEVDDPNCTYDANGPYEPSKTFGPRTPNANESWNNRSVVQLPDGTFEVSGTFSRTGADGILEKVTQSATGPDSSILEEKLDKLNITA